MTVKNLMNRVTKTVTVGNAKLQTPADRVGTGFMAVALTLPPAEFLSPGQFSMSQRQAHEPEPGSRQEEVSAMRYQPNAAIPTGVVGRFSGPVVRRNLLALRAEQANRQTHSRSHCPRTRPGSDCQSPARATDTTDRKRGSWRNATTANESTGCGDREVR
ncbi:hypothetical protein PX52LOC_07345 [Limnoglobus roseus]|uniref:Uncharacterized protein n=1 Tax=Limnoglobus roseus TaxID=2598579 RepID=A0A5C1AQC5_9BACT|nr:hypothetical protein PX52LOC_07345 [Limnoglobus roseus]